MPDYREFLAKALGLVAPPKIGERVPLPPDRPGDPLVAAKDFVEGLLGVKQDPGVTASGFGALLGAALPVGSGLKSLRSVWSKAGVTLDAYESTTRPIITLSKIEVPKNQRGQGIGSKAMRDLSDYADETGNVIALSPSTDFGASSVGRLKEFYKKFGFVENKGPNKDFTISETMYRPINGGKNP